MQIPDHIARQLRSIRISVAEETISYSEIAYLQSHAEFIDRDDWDLAQFVYEEQI